MRTVFDLINTERADFPDGLCIKKEDGEDDGDTFDMFKNMVTTMGEYEVYCTDLCGG